MQPAPRKLLMATVALAVLSACAETATESNGRPPAKPARLAVQLEGALDNTAVLGSVSTDRGEMLLMNSDGSVASYDLNSRRGAAELLQNEDQLLSLDSVLVADEGAIGPLGPMPPTAQEVALREFAARSGPALPANTTTYAPEAYLSSRVTPLDGTRSGDFVEVVAKLRAGVDDSTAFAYATCALADWASKSQIGYARHIRTLQQRQGGTLTMGSIFTISRQKPSGLSVMETKSTLRDCKARGIPAA